MNDDKPAVPAEETTGQNFYQPSAAPAMPDDGAPGASEAEEAPAAGTAPQAPQDGLEWDAAEYVHHPKNATWIVGLVAVAVLLAAFAFWLQAWTFLGLIVVMAVAFGIIAFRTPKTIHYKLNSEGITVGAKFYPLHSFRAYGLVADGDFYTVMLVPVKRLMPSITVFFSEAQGEQIIDILAPRLPKEVIREDPIESLMKYLHF